MATNLNPIHPSADKRSARVQGNKLIIEDFCERDTHVVALPKEAEGSRRARACPPRSRGPGDAGTTGDDRRGDRREGVRRRDDGIR